MHLQFLVAGTFSKAVGANYSLSLSALSSGLLFLFQHVCVCVHASLEALGDVCQAHVQLSGS